MKKRLFFIIGSILILSIVGFLIFSGGEEIESPGVPLNKQVIDDKPIINAPVCEDCRDLNGEGGGGSKYISNENVVKIQITSP